jgi:hypothetical protein
MAQDVPETTAFVQMVLPKTPQAPHPCGSAGHCGWNFTSRIGKMLEGRAGPGLQPSNRGSRVPAAFQ